MSKVSKGKAPRKVKRVVSAKSGSMDWHDLLGRSARFSSSQQTRIDELEADLKERLEPLPRRLQHSLSVGRSAESLALIYGVDPYLARVAGILHDWDKIVPHDELIARARAMDIDLGVDLDMVVSLLHGIVAARELPELYPDLPPEVFQAISRHTTGAADMTPLDDVIFVADGIEPLRPSSPDIAAVRKSVGTIALPNLYWEAFTGGISYVIARGRYLYPGTIGIYNQIVAQRTR